MKRIPITAAEQIAKTYGYDQVMIYARKIDRPAGVGETASEAIRGGEHMTTYGVDKKNCDAMKRIGTYLQVQIMNWTGAKDTTPPRFDLAAQVKILGADSLFPPSRKGR